MPVRVEDKPGLRAAALRRRRGGGLRSAALCVAPLLEGATCVAAYDPLPGEPHPGPLERPGLRVLLPALLADGDLAWHELAPGGALGGGAELAEADLVVVPALLVDRSGVRLGRGGGSYDRALPRRRSGVLAVALLASEEELVAALPREAHDALVDAVCVPSGLVSLPLLVRVDGRQGRT